MSSVAFTNIATLVTNDGAVQNGPLGILKGATVVVEDGLIASISTSIPSGVDKEIDCSEMTLLPGFVDSHSHLIFAGDRADEFAARSHGEKYTAGGIASTVKATRIATNGDLRTNAQRLLDEALSTGTTTMEIKSGYGLNVESELKMLRVIQQAQTKTKATLVPTCLSAHLKPRDFEGNNEEYLQYIVDEILPKVKEEVQ